MSDDVGEGGVPPVPRERCSTGEDFDFYGKIDEMVDGLGLPQRVFESSCGVSDLITSRDGFKYSFTSFGGFDVVVAVSVMIGARQERVPLPAEQVERFVSGSNSFSVTQSFSSKKLNQLVRKFRRELDGLEPVFLDAGDYIGFYGERLDLSVSALQQSLEGEMFVSQVAVRYTYKELVEGLTGVDTSGRALKDTSLTVESFGFHGDSAEEFAVYLYREAVDRDLSVLRKSPSVLAASCLYVAGKVI